jgi:hypothetical protein
MYCDEILELVEAVVSGDVAVDGRLAEHLASCPNCSSALESARALERMLQMRPSPLAPAQLTSRILTRVRRARWRSEQFVDFGFNVIIAVVILSIVGGVWMLLRRTGLSAVSFDALGIVGTGLSTLMQRAAPSLSLYAGATALLAMALWIWWWAERDTAL